MEKFPTLSLKSTRIDPTGSGELTVAGDLTIRSVARNAIFTVEGPTPPARDPWGSTRQGSLGQYPPGALGDYKDQPQRLRPRLEGALEAGSVLVGDEVTITLDVQFVKD